MFGNMKKQCKLTYMANVNPMLMSVISIGRKVET